MVCDRDDCLNSSLRSHGPDTCSVTLRMPCDNPRVVSNHNKNIERSAVSHWASPPAGPFRASRDRHLLDAGCVGVRRAVHDPAERAGYRRLGIAGVPVCRRPGRARSTRLLHPGFRDAACRWQLHLREPWPASLSRLRRQLLAVVRPVDRHRCDCVCDRAVLPRYCRCGWARRRSLHYWTRAGCA